jgi:peptide/nickel transport system permease protein
MILKKKISVLVLSFIVIYLFNFSIPRLMPGDPFSYNSSDASENVDIEMSEEHKEYMRAYYGMDKPVHEQLWNTIKSNLRGDFGQSIHFKRSAADVIRERLPWTLFIMGATLIISMLTGVLLALICIRNAKADRVIFGISSFVTEIPSYLIGVLLLFLVAAKVKWIPLSGAVTAFAKYDSVWEWIRDVLVHALLPVTAMCIFTIPKFYFTARASFLSIVGKPYLLNAKAKGLAERRIRWRYIFVNGITPIIARLFLSVGTTIGGTMLIENVFAYPGVGTVMREAVKYRDYIMIQDVFLLSTVIVLLSLFAADLLNGFVDREEH